MSPDKSSRAGRHVKARPQEKRHIGQDISHGHRLDVGHPVRARFVGRQYQALVGWQVEVLVRQFVPDELMNPLRIAFGWRE